MTDADHELLREIRDLLKEQNRMNAEALQRQAEHMAKAQEAHERSALQNAQALKHTGWLKWGFWVFLFALLMVFVIPNVWR